MPNLFATFVLFTYPLVVIVLFRRMPVSNALIWSIMGGYLFLPERTGIDLPLLPELDKDLIPSLTAAIMLLLTPKPPMRRNMDVRGANTRRGQAPVATAAVAVRHQPSVIANLCIATLFIAPIGVMLTNTDWVVFGPRVLPGIRLYDAFSMMLSAGVMLLPFLLARRHLGTHEAHVAMLWTFVKVGFVYSLLILIEVRLSPQLHRWFYGFHAHDFVQQIRFGGFRPMVFIQHGLRVGVFMLMVVIAAFTLYKIRASNRPPLGRAGQSATEAPKDKGLPLFVGIYFLAILLISKVVGAFMIAMIFVPFLMMTKPSQWRFLAAVTALLVLLYPMARSAGVVPVERVYNLASIISEDRAGSFRFRLNNEEAMLERAAQKPILGWGGWGRSRVYDPVTGADITVADGIWVIVFGVSGWVGYIALFGLLTLPAFAYFFAKGQLRYAIASQGLCLILATNLVDLMPNSGLTPVTWMVAGALLGRFERRDQSETQHTENPRPGVRRRTNLAVASPRQARRRPTA
ncbi:hypothetical protein [Cognatiyoonia sp. IB215182]|uniref:hypothetical protein n=1 Tax=Cognatiyoonia sp. IB215182 TaxID=3097353 RepID=UPI002A0D7C9E|nr:hypothetical protein [Cognatiyoonia sp. IB215182]MDX8353104.1 hypothetical protein [Cognatiyoonia sp. IB215182]